MSSAARLAEAIGLEPGVAAALESAQPFHLAPGAVAFAPGQPCPGYILLLEGAVSVRETTPDGREILLYRLQPGETCLQTALCLLGEQTYTAEATADCVASGLLLPPAAFDDLLARSAAFRRHVFRSVAARLEDFSRQVGRLAFQGVPARVASHLVERADGAGALHTTHEAIARTLGVAREAVSRALGAFERDGLVRLGRGRIDLIDRDGLVAVREGAGRG